MRPTVLWFGLQPTPGMVYRLAERGFNVISNPLASTLTDLQLSATRLAVFDHGNGSDATAVHGYARLPQMVNHGVRVLIIASDPDKRVTIRDTHLATLSKSLDWDRVLIFMPNCSGVNFDEFITGSQLPGWHQFPVVVREEDEPLAADERLLIGRAFPKAEELILREVPKGFSGSRVFMAYEKRKEESTSIAHWTQPRLVKVGPRNSIASEIQAMQAVSPFIPFELRPNLDTHVLGFCHGVYVADFVDHSESMLEAARAGRAEAALSNLFNRTMGRWRERGSQRPMSEESLGDAASRLGIVSPDVILDLYSKSSEAQQAGIDIHVLWERLRSIHFPHRVATIHGDLHGENVRVRGDDAILIDLGSVKGDDTATGGAPLCFDVAMLEVALVFTWVEGEVDMSYGQAAWRQEIAPYYQTQAIGRALEASSAPRDGGWMLGCLQRIRAFGVYQHDHRNEYPLALAIAMLRMCKYPCKTEADKGRRVRGLMIAAKIIDDIYSKGET